MSFTVSAVDMPGTVVDVAGDGPVRYHLWRGENLDVLAALADDLPGSVDLCYLDPPYNTRRDLTYRDRFGRSGDHDPYRSFLRPRLEVVRRLLADDGLVAISIDARELAHVIVLGDEVFGERNRMAVVTCTVKAAAGLGGGAIMDVAEYVVVWAKAKRSWGGRRLYRYEPMTELGEYRRRLVDVDDGTAMPPGDDAVEVFRHQARIERVGVDFLSGDAPLGGVFCTTNAQGVGRIRGAVPTRGLYRVRWRGGDGNPRERWFLDGRVVVFLDQLAIRVSGSVVRRVRETNVWDERWHQGLWSEGGVRFKEGKKPVAMLRRMLAWVGDDAVVLDPFAGSGSMLQAVGEANRDDGGRRQVLAVTNDEAGICTSICWPRTVGVVSGLRPDGRSTDKAPGSAALYQLEVQPPDER